MSFHIGWPQFIWLCLIALHVLNEVCHHGEHKIKEYDGVSSLIASTFTGLLLYWGGFFGN